MLVGSRAHRGETLQPWLAAWLAVLLVVAPFAHPAPLDLAGASGALPNALVAHDGTEDAQPAAKLRPAQPLAPGILSRLSLLEKTLGLPPLKPPLLRPAPEQPLLALQRAAAPTSEPRQVLQRSAVGTARTPTGPPA